MPTSFIQKKPPEKAQWIQQHAESHNWSQAAKTFIQMGQNQHLHFLIYRPNDTLWLTSQAANETRREINSNTCKGHAVLRMALKVVKLYLFPTLTHMGGADRSLVSGVNQDRRYSRTEWVRQLVFYPDFLLPRKLESEWSRREAS